MSAVAQLADNVAKLLEGQARQDKRLDAIDQRLREVEKVAQFGRGIGWAMLRIGAVAVAAGALWEWLRGQI